MIFLTPLSISPIIVNHYSKYCRLPLFKLMIKWTKKDKKKSFSVLKLNKNNSKLWSLKKEENTFLSAIKLFLNMWTLNITWAVQLTVPHQVSVLSKSNSENNFHKRMYSCSDPTELMKNKVIKSVSMPPSEFITLKLNATYLTASKECF